MMFMQMALPAHTSRNPTFGVEDYYYGRTYWFCGEHVIVRDMDRVWLPYISGELIEQVADGTANKIEFPVHYRCSSATGT